jgi:hypothetical protein
MKTLKISLLTNTKYTILSTITVTAVNVQISTVEYMLLISDFSQIPVQVSVLLHAPAHFSLEKFFTISDGTPILSSEQVESRTWLEFENNVWMTAAHLNSLNIHIFHFKELVQYQKRRHESQFQDDLLIDPVIYFQRHIIVKYNTTC